MDGPSILQGEPTFSIAPDVVVKRAIFTMAKDLVDPIIEAYGLEPYRGPGPSAFTAGMTYTKADQHIRHILDVADWLLGKEG